MFDEQLHLPPQASTGTVLETDLSRDTPAMIFDHWLVDVEQSAIIVVSSVTLTNPDSLQNCVGKMSFQICFEKE
ncbi:hypothetical protein N7520_002318 [Penicillium odoratum]|uniref:uncharacterized protein n=1 Tax=Penicillium odoratum TaxID=1167516 RepID=UPI002546863B|nr:uncharacterized protein N7520_002318 [Penicillium odoratum]KAJ5771789.1 hypothetical protein N7520_002318 [Penicillium odoratum]